MYKVVFAYIFALLFSYSFQTIGASTFSSKQNKTTLFSSSIEIIAYPNPFNEGINIDIITNNTHPTTLRVFDIIGIEKERIEFAQFGHQNVYHVHLKDLPLGIYFCNVYSDNKLLESKKIVCLK